MSTPDVPEQDPTKNNRLQGYLERVFNGKYQAENGDVHKLKLTKIEKLRLLGDDYDGFHTLGGMYAMDLTLSNESNEPIVIKDFKLPPRWLHEDLSPRAILQVRAEVSDTLMSRGYAPIAKASTMTLAALILSITKANDKYQVFSNKHKNDGVLGFRSHGEPGRKRAQKLAELADLANNCSDDSQQVINLKGAMADCLKKGNYGHSFK